MAALLYELCFIFAAAALFLTVFSAPPKGQLCPSVEGQPSCVCRIPKKRHHPGGLINLTSIASTTGYPRFTDISDGRGSTYSYNPCRAFTPSFNCINCHICKKNSTSGSNQIVGYAWTEHIYYDVNGFQDSIYIYYNTTTPMFSESYVQLVCNPKVLPGQEYIKAIGKAKHAASRYKFKLHSCWACPGGCKC